MLIGIAIAEDRIRSVGDLAAAMVHTAVSKQAADPDAEALALWQGVVDELGG